jgi:hypothetical protein
MPISNISVLLRYLGRGNEALQHGNVRAFEAGSVLLDLGALENRGWWLSLAAAVRNHDYSPFRSKHSCGTIVVLRALAPSTSCEMNIEINARLFDVLGAVSDYGLSFETGIALGTSIIFTGIIVDVGTR